jgi:hypothetical protein
MRRGEDYNKLTDSPASHMGRKSKTQLLTESILGQHLALSVAAHLARTQLVPDPLTVYDAQHMGEMIDVVASALAKVAPLYVQDAKTGAPRELTPLELDGAAVRRSASVIALKDGRTLSSVSMKRADLRQAIAILKAVGIPELRTAAPKRAAAPRPEPDLLVHVAELESLLRAPLIPSDVEKANRVAVGMARRAREGRIANLAMQLVSALHQASHEGAAECAQVGIALAHLRAAVEEEEATRSEARRD